LEEKFLAGQGQNITPARYSKDLAERQKISDQVKATLGAAAKVLNVVGYCRIDAFVRVFDNLKTEVIFIEVNSLPGMTPATCIYHQAAINHYKPYEFINNILEFGAKRFSIKGNVASK
jgi:D-alanine-D-alanine ligase